MPTSSTNPPREISAFYRSMYSPRPDGPSRSRQDIEQQASPFQRSDVRPRSSAQELQTLRQDIHQLMTSSPPERSLDYFKQAEQLIERIQSISSGLSNPEKIRLSTSIQEHRIRTSDALFERDYQHTISGDEFMIHVETNDREHTHHFPAYTTTALPSGGMMVLEQAYHERINDPDKVLPYTVILRNQWKEATQNKPEQYPLRMIRSNNVTNQEVVSVAKECIRGLPRTEDGGVELVKGSDGFQRILKTRIGRNRQRLLEQNPDIFENKEKEIQKIIVDDGAGNSLDGLRFFIGNKE